MLDKIEGCSELLLIIFSYLNASDLINIDLLSKRYHSHDVLNYLWLEHCKRMWGIKRSEADSFQLTPSNKFKLLYFAASPLPNDLMACDSTLSLTGTQVRFFGKVGVENRSVKSTTAFPQVTPKPADTSILSTIIDVLFCRRMLTKASVPMGRRFSCPFVDGSSLRINTSLRSVAYYEIQISRGYSRVRSYSNFNGFVANDRPVVRAAADEGHADDEGLDVLPECIAVGLSSSRFNPACRLPGWDAESFGYHSDDGCLFHGKGVQMAAYGPKFGIGDVVGCGISYNRRCIFFTLNGRYLGDAFADISGELFPTVGIDAEVSVTFNFGRAPFTFDIGSYEGLQ